MKRIISVLLVSTAFVISFSCCKKKTTSKSDIVVDIPYSKAKVLPAIDSPFNIISLPIEITDSFATKVDEYLNTYAGGISKSKIKSLKPLSMNVQVDPGTAQTLNFVDDSVKIYVDKYGGTTPILVAYKKGIPNNAKSIDFDIISTDIKDLFYEPYMQVTLKFNTKAGEKVLAGANFISNFAFRIVADPN
ncbi:MAG TPA: hypothetical protein PLU17_13070 [Chitinophagaceae bacterium]|jgi:hypothetical protein|nr:hypothetical protein [Chitinophagaceae bacterium]